MVAMSSGDVFWLLGLARHLDADQPVLSVQPPGLDGTEPLRSIEALARYQIEQIRSFRPTGPYLLAGHCAGGTLALEIAQQLKAAGQPVALLALLGSPFPAMFRRGPQLWSRLRQHAKALSSGSLGDRAEYILSRLQKRLGLRPPDPTSLVDHYTMRAAENPAFAAVSPALLEARQRVEHAMVEACRAYQPKPYAGRIELFVTSEKWHGAHRWRVVASDIHEHEFAEFEINELLLGPDVTVLAASLQETLDRALATLEAEPGPNRQDSQSPRPVYARNRTARFPSPA
jgi:thioesterase domain-containing protein